MEREENGDVCTKTFTCPDCGFKATMLADEELYECACGWKDMDYFGRCIQCDNAVERMQLSKGKCLDCR